MESIRADIDSGCNHEHQLLQRAVKSTPSMRRAYSNGTRAKSYTETSEELRSSTAVQPTRTRPYSAGDADELRRVAISGFSQNSRGTWIFKVDVVCDDENSYAIRRRFSDFIELYEGLKLYVREQDLPPLPEHGLFSWLHLYIAPESLLEERVAELQHLLEWVGSHPRLCSSPPFSKFVGSNPSSIEVGYVSLSSYEVPESESNLNLVTRLRSRCRSE